MDRRYLAVWWIDEAAAEAAGLDRPMYAVALIDGDDLEGDYFAEGVATDDPREAAEARLQGWSLDLHDCCPSRKADRPDFLYVVEPDGTLREASPGEWEALSRAQGWLRHAG